MSRLWKNDDYRQNQESLRQNEEYRTNASKKRKAIWANKDFSNKQCIAVIIGDEKFRSIRFAARSANITIRKLQARLRSDKYPEYQYA